MYRKIDLTSSARRSGAVVKVMVERHAKRSITPAQAATVSATPGTALTVAAIVALSACFADPQPAPGRAACATLSTIP